MAEKINDFTNRFMRATPKGLGLGLKLLLGTSAAVYGLYRSMYTGKKRIEIELGRQTFLFV